MTRLNFLAAGIRDAPCFDTPLTLDMITMLRMPSINAVRDLFRTCWKDFEVRNTRGPEVDMLRKRLSRVPPDVFVAWRKKIFNIAGWLPPWRK
jgi:predicted glycosyltransferase